MSCFVRLIMILQRGAPCPRGSARACHTPHRHLASTCTATTPPEAEPSPLLQKYHRLQEWVLGSSPPQPAKLTMVLKDRCALLIDYRNKLTFNGIKLLASL